MADSNSLAAGKLGGLKVRKAKSEEQHASIIIYGDQGIGKTTLAGSISEVPEMCPVLHLNIENGAQSLKIKYPDIDVLDINSIVELQDVYRELNAKSGAGYKTITLDNLTETQSQGMEHFQNNPKGGDFIEFEGATFANGIWSKSSEQMRKLIRYFRGLPCNTVFIAWKKDYSGADSNKPDYRPAFTRTFGGEAPGMVNDVYHYYRAGENRVLQTEISERAIAKDRTGLLPRNIKEPTFSKIHDYWVGNLVKPTAAEKEETNKSRLPSNSAKRK